MDEETELVHESYGVIAFANVSLVHGTPLFGSSIRHSAGVMVEIKEAQVTRKLSRDWIHPSRILFRGMLSPNQFASAITHMNQGGGTPITLEYMAGDATHRRATPPMDDKRGDFEREAQSALAKTVEMLFTLKGTMKTQKGMKEVDQIIQQIRSNIPFVEEQFAIQMDKTVADAKAEVEAFVAQRITQEGYDALMERQEREPERLALPPVEFLD